MKKIIALILAVIMMFSMTSVSYAADATVLAETSSTATIDNYMDYLETKLESGNIFVKLIARLVIFGVMLGLIKVEDFEAWFDNTAPDTDTDTGVDNDKPVVDDNTSTDWEDGTEVKLHPSQKLPYTQNGVTITDIKVTKEHYNNIPNEYDSYYLYKYNITVEGYIDESFNLEDGRPSLSIYFENGKGVSGGLLGSRIHGPFQNTSERFSNDDSDTFLIYSIVQ